MVGTDALALVGSRPCHACPSVTNVIFAHFWLGEALHKVDIVVRALAAGAFNRVGSVVTGGCALAWVRAVVGRAQR